MACSLIFIATFNNAPAFLYSESMRHTMNTAMRTIFGSTLVGLGLLVSGCSDESVNRFNPEEVPPEPMIEVTPTPGEHGVTVPGVEPGDLESIIVTDTYTFIPNAVCPRIDGDLLAYIAPDRSAPEFEAVYIRPLPLNQSPLLFSTFHLDNTTLFGLFLDRDYMVYTSSRRPEDPNYGLIDIVRIVNRDPPAIELVGVVHGNSKGLGNNRYMAVRDYHELLVQNLVGDRLLGVGHRLNSNYLPGHEYAAVMHGDTVVHLEEPDRGADVGKQYLVTLVGDDSLDYSRQEIEFPGALPPFSLRALYGNTVAFIYPEIEDNGNVIARAGLYTLDGQSLITSYLGPYNEETFDWNFALGSEHFLFESYEFLHGTGGRRSLHGYRYNQAGHSVKIWPERVIGPCESNISLSGSTAAFSTYLPVNGVPTPGTILLDLERVDW